MKRYANLFLLGFICLWLNNSASVNDKQAVKQGLNKLFNEPNQENFIDYAGLPQYRVIANTNIVGRFLVIDEKQIENLGVDLSNVTVAKMNTWKDNNMETPNHLQWAKGETWEQVVIDNGLEIVPQELPQELPSELPND